MLIIPIQDRIDWRRPPLLALALVLVNIFMYLFSLAHDRPLEQGLDQLDTDVLTQFEWPLLLEKLRDEDILLWQEASDADSSAREEMLWHYWFDRDWDSHVRAVWQTQEAVNEDWRFQRNQLEQYRNDLSWVRWGFTPAAPTLSAVIISTFLHADHWHLFGNMLFLLLFAPALERHWGIRKLFAIYLLTGFTASLLHWLAEPDSMIPSIGASGAVSGLMGAYVATYGLRRIEFFYTVGFFFGSFRAPALMVFPAWLGKELFEHFFSDSNVNYMAHAGGMIGGLLLVALMKARQPAQVQAQAQATLDPAGPATDAPRDPVPARLRRLYDELAFDQAWRGAMSRLEQTPKKEMLWLFCLEAAQKCGPKILDQSMTDAFRRLSPESQQDALLSRLIQGYLSLGGDTGRLAPACGLLEAELLFRQKRFADARSKTRQLATHWQHPRLTRLESMLDQAGH